MEKQYKSMKQTKENFLAFLREKYPAGIPRCRVTEATGGLVAAKTLANISSGTGDGPEGEYRVRGRVVYPVESFCRWIFGEESC